GGREAHRRVRAAVRTWPLLRLSEQRLRAAAVGEAGRRVPREDRRRQRGPLRRTRGAGRTADPEWLARRDLSAEGRARALQRRERPEVAALVPLGTPSAGLGDRVSRRLAARVPPVESGPRWPGCFLPSAACAA